jgi:hypothetical protein
MTFDELIENITQWADDKEILSLENVPQQSMKVMEELGETVGAILKQKRQMKLSMVSVIYLSQLLF